MNKKYLIGIYKISKQNNYIVAHALYSYARKPVESESIYLGLKVYTFLSINNKVYTLKPMYILPLPDGMMAHTLQHTGLMSGPSAPQCPSHLT